MAELDTLLEVRDLRKYFPVGGFLSGTKGWVKAVDDINFKIGRGETLGLVGESGCGKTTTSKLVLAAEPVTAGSILYEDTDIVGLKPRDLMEYRRKVQVVFQDPFSSLSPRLRVGEILAEPIVTHEKVSRAEINKRVGELLELVGLRPDMDRLFPHEFSGGQRQRIAIARALATNAELIVLDEPVSALDVSIRAHIIGLLEDLQKNLGVSYLFIGHDLAAVAHISHRIAVMYLGKIVEIAESLELCENPLHPYTKALFAASLPSHPDEEREEIVLTGEVPSALNPPEGCRFHTRCPFMMPQCSQEVPRTEGDESRPLGGVLFVLGGMGVLTGICDIFPLTRHHLNCYGVLKIQEADMAGDRIEWDDQHTLRKIGLRPEQVKPTVLGHDTVIKVEIGGSVFQALVPTKSLGKDQRFVPAEQVGRIGDKLIIVLPPSNDGTPIWHVREDDLDEVLVP